MNLNFKSKVKSIEYLLSMTAHTKTVPTYSGTRSNMFDRLTEASAEKKENFFKKEHINVHTVIVMDGYVHNSSSEGYPSVSYVSQD